MRVCGYVRVSSEAQADNLSIPTQIRLINDYAERQGWPAPTLYEDKAKSAYNDDLAARPAFAQLVADAETERIDVLLVTDLDRLARNTSLALIVADRLAKVGCKIVSLNQGGDFRTPDGRLMFSLSSSFAEYASAQISRKSKAGLAHIRANGGHVGGLHYGAKRDADRRLQINPNRADTLALILRLVARGSYDSVAGELNRLGIPPPKGGPCWRSNTISSIVRSGRWLLDQPDPWPALWSAAANRPRLAHGNTSKRTNALTGLLRCACGGVIVYSGVYTLRSGGRTASLQCRRWSAERPTGGRCPYPKHRAAYYEALAEAALLGLPDLTGVDVTPPDIAAARDVLRARRLNLARAVARGLPDDEADLLQREIDAAEGALPLDSGTERAVAAALLVTQWGWPNLDDSAKNAAYRGVVRRFVITGYELRAEWVPALQRLLDAVA